MDVHDRVRYCQGMAPDAPPAHVVCALSIFLNSFSCRVLYGCDLANNRTLNDIQRNYKQKTFKYQMKDEANLF